MYTYQDLLEIGESEEVRMNFILSAISAHKSSDVYTDAYDANEYDCRRNITIIEYQKLLYTITGEAIPDNFSADYKLRSNFFNRFVTQQTQYLLGNGISLTNGDDKEKLGKDFDMRLQELGRDALVDGVAFGFWNLDHLEVFRVTEFAPLWDEETGGLAAGIRFWQIDASKPLRATLYELDGYTEYMWKDDEGEILRPKRKYVLRVAKTPADGPEIIDGMNYPSFPIVPLWGNPAHQSELVGIREQIDAYDLIKSGFANDIDDASLIYWTINNAGGMDDVDLAKFVQHMKTIKAAVVDDDGARAEAHTMEIPYTSREVILERLRSDLYDDFMALDTKNIAGGAATATQIKAAYEPINNKADMFEYCVLDFINRLFELVGIESDASFTRSMVINTAENIQIILQAAQILPADYIVKKVLELFGDGDKADEILELLKADEFRRIAEDGEDGFGQEDDGQGAQSAGGQDS